MISIIRFPFGSLSIGWIVAVAILSFSTANPNSAVAQDTPVTFTKDIAPIFQDSCQTCHREGAIAPMSLMTYEESRP